MKKLLLRGFLALCGVLLLLVAAAVGWRAVRQHRLAEAMAIPVGHGIDERRFVRIGGVDQWIVIRGQNRDNPAILMLHGGPGAASSALEQLFFPWEREFTVVQWDQRGAGKSFSSGRATASIDLMVHDALEISEYVRRRLQKNKLILLGHSWGSVLGVHMLKARPDMFHAWVGTGQIMNMQKNEVVAYARVLAKARARGDKNAIDALEKSGAPPYHQIQQMGLERRWAMQYESGLEYKFPTGPQLLLEELLTAPDYSLNDVVNYIRGVVDGDAFFGETLDGPMMRIDLPALGTDFSMPFFVVQGADDDITPAALAQEYFDQVTAPRKAMLLIPDAAHMALMTRSDRFLQFLLTNVRQLALQP
ncbi:MAG: alpha/beta hydrolase [Acidobacteriia bacterium]|nr:alpha/beta hydrolase [Terriglobia bacterium]